MSTRYPGANRFGAIPNANGGISRLACAEAKTAGIEIAPLLKQSGLTPQQMDDPAIRLNVSDQIRFLNQVATALQDDFLGFHLALPVDLREIGLLYYVSATSETLIEALRRTARYSSIVNEGVVIQCVEGDDLGMSFRYVGVSRHLDRHQIEFFVTALVRICRQLTGQQLSPKAVQLIHRRPAFSSKFREFLGRDIKFGAAVDEIRFPASARNLPVVSADPHLNKLLITYCEEALARRPSKVGSFRSEVESLIAQLLPHGKARMSELARRLGTSSRSFARRLSSEGVTYSEILESLRRDLAERYLADETLTISQIAWLLGYQEVSAFTHAYKRRTGKSPRDRRARC